MYASLLRPLLFRLDPERAHQLTLLGLQLPFAPAVLRARFGARTKSDPVDVFGLRFPNRVGLAAGYDKNGVAGPGLAALGFGHIEIGTVTRLPQAGNPKPRVHRFPEARAVVNSMGFPNDGVDALLPRLPSMRASLNGARLGINIGKGKDTPLERAAEDYCALFKQVHRHADYVAINISSPNTMNLRALQAREAILGLLRAVAATRSAECEVPSAEQATQHFALRTQHCPPILVKIAPDLAPAELDDVLDAIAQTGMDGIIATNTTLRRDGLPASAAQLKGGTSGAPLTELATGVIRHITRATSGKLPIIGVGGIMNANDAKAKLDAGATLVQLYTGMIFAGPGLAQQISSGQ
jgi:dihydroorotate dehydrogenase